MANGSFLIHDGRPSIQADFRLCASYGVGAVDIVAQIKNDLNYLHLLAEKPSLYISNVYGLDGS